MSSFYRWTVLVILLSMVNAVQAQERPTLKRLDKRLIRVEKILDQSLLEMLQEIDGLKQQIRVLRGELESQAYELDREKRLNQDRFLKTDQRLTIIEQPEEPLDPNGEPGTEGSGQSGSVDQERLPVFVRDTDTAQAPSTKAPESPQDTAAQVAAEVAATPASEAEKAAYAEAHELLATGDFDAAVTGFGKFLVEFPVGSFSDNAWYWQGEALYAQRKFDEAIENFRTVIESFPGSPKVPGAQLKVGYAQFEQKQYKSARNTLTGVQQSFPQEKAAQLAQQRLQEMNAKGL